MARAAFKIALGVLLLGLIGGVWVLSLPLPTTFTEAPPIAEEERAAILEALRPRTRERPLIAIIGINDATEVTDYLMPYGVLQRSQVADVVLVAIEPGPVELYPALTVEPQSTASEFDAQHPEGADYVIVPAMSRDDDPAVLAWLKSQSARGAMVIGVCAGAKVVGAAGLLDGKRATTHWYYLDDLLERSPSIRYVPDRRMVAEPGVATTTGVTASMPMALTLIEAIGGREQAEAVGREIGVTQWDARHDSDAFQFTRPFALTAMANRIVFWKHEELGLELTPGVDEVSLALVADAWSRTYRSRAVTFSSTENAQRSRNGVRIVPDRVVSSWPAEDRLEAIGDRPPAAALDHALRAITIRYGKRTGDFVAMHLEYPSWQLTKGGNYSYRNATIGSMRLARLAGSHTASHATASSTSDTTVNVIGSQASTP
jgi:transcriptional regulator GlxA family with amidase domain